MPCLYMITMPDGKQYIGVTTKTAEKRYAKHVEDAKGGRDTSIADAMRRCKFKGIRVDTLLESDNIDLLFDVEPAYINQYQTRIPKGHNATNGGRGMKGCIRKDICGEYILNGEKA